ncbi:hypothetical protein [Taylorella equigenitalis]|uniref:hypothetical protein n=1 Tax=Taylorella equigenitalis TaxID=29575 RepID=UPI000AC1B0C1|nr:hypothetical protein [Taylorella equigenitalis]
MPILTAEQISQHREAVDSAKDKVDEVKEKATEKTEEAVDSAKDKVEEAKDKAVEKTEEAVDSALGMHDSYPAYRFVYNSVYAFIHALASLCVVLFTYDAIKIFKSILNK